ncbi:MAG: AraC family transcriptional regulator [Lachnospiraceae bacterium]|nr:AraC family transcriptional regulator [Lachnospiraceae bacterium]
MDIKRELNHKLFTQREAIFPSPNINDETLFFHAISSGDLELLKEKMDVYFEQRRNYGRNDGRLSQDYLTNRKYYFVMLASTIMRFCISAGMDRETAFSLCCIYINRADKMTKRENIDELEVQMQEDFTKRMQEYRKRNVISKQITKCIDYIYDNLHYKMTVESIAAHLDMNPSYLSKLFSKEMNISISAYIKEQRLAAAAKMLEITDLSISEISEYFTFSSQSHFTTDFHKKYNMTPKKYRNTFYINKNPRTLN